MQTASSQSNSEAIHLAVPNENYRSFQWLSDYKLKETFSFTIESDGGEQCIKSGLQGCVVGIKPDVEDIRFGENNFDFRTTKETQPVA